VNLLAQNYDFQAIADALPGRTRTAVIVRHQRVSATVKGRSIDNGAPQTQKNRGSWTEHEHAIALEMHKAGYYIKAISQKLGRTWRSVFIRVQGIAYQPKALTKKRNNQRWKEREDRHLVELRAFGLKVDAIAGALGRTLRSVDRRWQKFPQWRKDGRSGPCDSEDISAKSSQERHQQPSSKASQIDAQSRRSFTTAHGRNPRSDIDTQEHSLPLSYGPQQLVGVGSWKHRGIFSLPYRPQRRLNHTGELLASGSAKRVPFQPWSEQDDRRVIDLRAAGYPWTMIASTMRCGTDRVHARGLSLLKEEQWLQRFEEIHSTLPEYQKHKASRNTRYSAKENAVIMEMRKAGSTFKAIGQALNRPPKSISYRCKMNSKSHNPLAELSQATRHHEETRKRFNSEEKEQLRQMASLGTTIYHMAQTLGRPTGSMYHHLQHWGFHDLWLQSRAHGQGSWSESDDHILRSAIESGKRGIEVWQLMPGRKPLDIWKRCQVLGINDTGIQATEWCWLAAEDAELLRSRADGKSFKEISMNIGKSPESCRARWAKLVNYSSPRPTRSRRTWTSAEDAHLLRLNADGIGHDKIAAILKKPSGTSCKNRLSRLKVGKQRVNIKWTAFEDEELQRLAADGKPDDQISTILNRTAGSCRNRRWKLRILNNV
jgi:DNA-binding CsgD family transcriptional regulator